MSPSKKAPPSSRAAVRSRRSRGQRTGKPTKPSQNLDNRSSEGGSASELQSWLQLAQLRSEKCELKEAEVAYGMALEQSRRESDLRGQMEALSGLLRLAGEALNQELMNRLDRELNEMMAAYPDQVPPLAWYCKGAIARHRHDSRLAQRFFHRYLHAVRRDPQNVSSSGLITPEEGIVKGWVMLAITSVQRGNVGRARWLAHEILKRWETKNLPGVNGMLYLVMGNVAELESDPVHAMEWYRKAHSSFLGEHNWYYHLYVLYGYARVSRMQRNFPQASFYLDLIDKATSRPEFGLLRREVASERKRLEDDAVDLIIDARMGVIRTREGGEVSLRKQYVLLSILEALSVAHGREGHDDERGLSKAEIIERVWKENYRPEAHDNKLYYNINRLRRLLEPDVKNPQYLLNWKEGYRLAPGLRVHFVGGRA